MFYRIIDSLKDRLIKFLFNIKLGFILGKTYKVHHNKTSIYFNIVNYISYFRARSFSKKEPETLNWIDKFDDNSIFFDIGANVGIYSIYAAKSKRIKVYCFEPSVFNLELLVKNIQLNNANNNTYIAPIAINFKNSIESLNLSDLSNAAALSNFGNNYDQFGNQMTIKNYYNTIGMELDYFVKIFNIEYPKYIKIDVDGIEHLVLKGMNNILDNAKSILIELTSSFKEQIESSHEILKSKGFVLSDKTQHSQNFETQNQIWVKEN